MKYYALIITSLLSLMGCADGNQATSHQCVVPLENGFSSIDSLNNCTVAVTFVCEDINRQEKSLDITAYREFLYDSVSINRLQKGDTLMLKGEPIVVDSLERRDGFVGINGGIERRGVDLTAHEGGTYRATTFNNHSIYQEIGNITLKLADDFILIDCGEDFSDPCDTISENQYTYLSNLPENRRDFFQMNTRIRIENGLVKEINRRWIP